MIRDQPEDVAMLKQSRKATTRIKVGKVGVADYSYYFLNFLRKRGNIIHKVHAKWNYTKRSVLRRKITSAVTKCQLYITLIYREEAREAVVQ